MFWTGPRHAIVRAALFSGAVTAASAAEQQLQQQQASAAGAFETLPFMRVGHLRAPQTGEGGAPAVGAASAPASHALDANVAGLRLASPAAHETLSAQLSNAKLSAGGGGEAGGGGIKLMSPGDREAMSARLRKAKATAAAGGSAAAKPDFDLGSITVFHYAVDNENNTSSGSGRRKLQTCAAGSVFVTSSEFPFMEGCLQENVVGGEVQYGSDTGFIAPLPVEGETEDYWVALYRTSTTTADLTQACISTVPAGDVHPSEAAWVCLFPDGTSDYGTATTFGVDCGCAGSHDDDDDATSPVPAPTPSASASTPGPASGSRGSLIPGGGTTSTSAGDGACDAGSISVTSSEFPLMEGCLVPVDAIVGGELEYISETALIAALPDDSDVEYWFAFYIPIGSEDPVQACNSAEPVSEVHPTEATWVCLFSDGTITAATPATFSVDCGCAGADDDDATIPAPAPTPSASTGTPAPITTGTTSATDYGSCTAGSISVTSSEFPFLEGCLIEEDLIAGGELEYSSDTGFILAGSTPDSNVDLWFALYRTSSTSEDLVQACSSEEPASEVHPTEATWFCLLSDGTVDAATATTFGVDCGCVGGDDDAPVSAPTPAAPTPASPVAPVGGGDDGTDDNNAPTQVIPIDGDDDTGGAPPTQGEGDVFGNGSGATGFISLSAWPAAAITGVVAVAVAAFVEAW